MARSFPEGARALRAATRPADEALAEYGRYRDDPAGFARDKLGIYPTPKQVEMWTGLLAPPYRVLSLSANEQGKTLGAACAALWWDRTREPVIGLTTAPKFDQVKDLLWKEIRTLARRLRYPPSFLPRACRMERAANDFVAGVTARDATAFQGHHGPNMLFIFDEATGIEAEFWTAVESMFSPPGHAWLAIFNPTTTSSQVYVEFGRAESAARRAGGSVPPWHVVRMSALDHPNIDAELRGRPPVVPHAMRLDKFDRLLRQWSTLTGANPNLPVGAPGGPEAGDIVWPPVWATKLEGGPFRGQPARVYRPGPEAEARLLARFPSQGTTAVWGDGDWLAACRELPGLEPLDWPEKEVQPVPEVGCDVARFGDDKTEIHARCGPISLSHEAASKRPTDQTAGRLIEVARGLARWWNERTARLQEAIRPRPISEYDIPIKVDDDGVGGAVTDILSGQGYNVVRVSAASTPNDEEHYPNKRSELWFVTAEMARSGRLDLSRLDPDTRDELRRQAMTAKWSLDSQARRVVMPKDKIKAELGRSPDGADALNLAYFPATASGPGATTTTTRQGPYPQWGFRR